MGDNREYMTHPEENGSINISEDVVSAIAVGAVCEVEGVAGMLSGGNVTELMMKKSNPSRGVRLEMDGEAVVLDLYVTVKYGFPIPEMALTAQKAVATAVEAMTGFAVSAVNIHVGGIAIA